jgi:hypothetical protein
MASSGVEPAAASADPIPAGSETRGRTGSVRGQALALPLAYALGLIVLIVLRALVRHLGFISMGWLLVLALVPILPWLIPALAPLAARVAPFVQSVKLPGGFEIALGSAARPAAGLGQVEDVLTADHLAQGLVASPMPFTTTDAMTVISGVQAVRSTGADTVVVDLGTGMKWRLPNLYFLAWLIANEPVLHWVVFTENRSNTSGLFVGLCGAADVCTRIEAAYPQYAQVATQLEYLDVRRPTAGPTQPGPGPSALEPMRVQHLSDQFNRIRSQVAPPAPAEVPTLAWVTAQDLRNILGPHLATTALPWSGDIDRVGLQQIVRSPVPYVAATTPDGGFRGLLDQREIALEFTRRVLEEN